MSTTFVGISTAVLLLSCNRISGVRSTLNLSTSSGAGSECKYSEATSETCSCYVTCMLLQSAPVSAGVRSTLNLCTSSSAGSANSETTS